MKEEILIVYRVTDADGNTLADITSFAFLGPDGVRVDPVFTGAGTPQLLSYN